MFKRSAGSAGAGQARGPTIRDIAAQAGVSTATVSYVLTGRDRSISDATRERVLEAARALGYRPNALARGLAQQRTRTIGLVLVGGSATTFRPVVRGVTAAARAAGHSVLLSYPENRDTEAESVRVLLEHRVAGIVLVAFSYRRDADGGTPSWLAESDVPFVVVNRPFREGGEAGGRVDAVYWDNRGAAVLATQHLLGLGHRRLAFVSRVATASARAAEAPGLPAPPPGGEADVSGDVSGDVSEQPHVRFEAVQLRLAGFHDAIAAEPDAEGMVVQPAGAVRPGVIAALRPVLAGSARPTGLICFNDEHAAAALRAALESGLRVPQDLAVVGFDNSQFAGLSVPSLTSVALPGEAAGRHAVGLVLRRLRQPAAPPAREMLPCKLVVRESSGDVVSPQLLERIGAR